MNLRRLASESHWSDCAVHSEEEPAPCDCGAARAARGFWSSFWYLGCMRGEHLKMNFLLRLADGFRIAASVSSRGLLRIANRLQFGRRSMPRFLPMSCPACGGCNQRNAGRARSRAVASTSPSAQYGGVK